MLYTKRIYKTLKFIDQEYNKYSIDPDHNQPIMYSKLGILELCGWIEEAFDEIAINCVRSKLRTNSVRSQLIDTIENTYGFSYEKLFIHLLGFALGTVNLRKVETKFAKNGNLSLLKSELGQLKKQRNEAAHTYSKNTPTGTTPTFYAPSTTIARFEKLEPIIKDLWHIVKEVSK